MKCFCPTCKKDQLVTIVDPSVCTVCGCMWKAKKPYVLSEQDRTFLKTNRIQPEI